MSSSGWSAYGMSLSAVDHEFVRSFRQWVTGYEAEVSGLVTSVAEVFEAARLTGYEERVKTLDSLSRKVTTDRVKNPELSLPEVVAGTGDVLRYSMVISERQFAATTQRALVEFADRQCSLVGVKNGFVLGDNDYRGYNTKWRTKDQVPFEVQFHTPESWRAGKQTHGIYEQIRLPGIEATEKSALERLRRGLYEPVAIPAGVDRIVPPEDFPSGHRPWRARMEPPAVGRVSGNQMRNLRRGRRREIER